MRAGEVGHLLAVQRAARPRACSRRAPAPAPRRVGVRLLAAVARRAGRGGQRTLVAAAALGGVEGAVGGVDQRVRVVEPVGAPSAPPTRAVTVQLDAVGRSIGAAATRGAQPLADARSAAVVRRRRRSSTQNSSPPQRAATSRGAQRAGDALGHAAQHRVAGRVAVGVVDALEVVDVEQQHGGRPALGRRGAARLQLLGEVAAVGQARQRVGARAAFGLPARRLELRVGLVETPHVRVQIGGGGALARSRRRRCRRSR